MKVKDLTTSDVKSCREYNALNTAAQVMWDHDIGCVPMWITKIAASGMLTDRDCGLAGSHGSSVEP